MTAKEYLLRYRLLSQHLEDLQNQLDSLREEAGAVSVNMDGMPRGTDISDRTGKLASSIADLAMRSIEQRDRILWARSDISDTLRQLEDPTQYRVLYLRYIGGLRWEQIAVETGYTYRSVTRIHGAGLKSVQAILDERCPIMSY